MDNLDVSQMERALSEFKRQEYLKKLRPSEYLREQADAFRKGIGNRQKARQVLGSIVTPPAIEYVSLDTSFLIWPFRFGGDPQFSLFESHTQPLNNFANIVVNSEFDSDFFVVDQVAFYFMWQNDTGSDAVLNVEAFLNLSGLCVVRAKPGYLWTPFWNVSNIGKCRMVVSANLALLEWWNQPPTQPLQQVGQVERAKDLSVSGGFIIVTVGDNFEFEVVQSSHHLHYDQFFVPRDGIAVFEVSLQLSYSGYKGLVSAFFDTSDRRITCPSVELEIVTGSTSPVIHG
jgi:hypothetical protein